MGCDGIVLAGANDATVRHFLGDHISTLEGYRATCIVYL
jgi:hypothetical protein